MRRVQHHGKLQALWNLQNCSKLPSLLIFQSTTKSLWTRLFDSFSSTYYSMTYNACVYRGNKIEILIVIYIGAS